MDVGHMSYSANIFSAVWYERRRITGGSTLEATLGADSESATLAWLVSALEQARTQGESKAVGYLEAVADDVVVFEIEMAAHRRRASS